MALDPITLPEKYENTEEECDAVLGGYMRIWNHLEMSISSLFRKLLDTDTITANIILSASINQNTVRDILEALGKHRLKQADNEKLKRFLHRIKKAASTRNRLVHGIWRLNLVMSDKPRVAKRAEWVRFYQPTDPEAYQKMYGRKKDQKLLAAHEFTLNRIVCLANEVGKLANEANEFEKSLELIPPRIPKAVF